jgi:hypothetical protein
MTNPISLTLSMNRTDFSNDHGQVGRNDEED